MKKLIIIMILFSLPVVIISQNISGYWEGSLYQKGSILSEEYFYSMTIQQNGNVITGFSEISTSAGKNYGKISLVGIVKKKKINGKQSIVLSFEESEITSESIDENYFWCIKKGDLSYSKSGTYIYLKGPWWSEVNPTCPPGKIILKQKVMSKPEPVANNTKQKNDYTNRKQSKSDDIVIYNETFTISVYDHARIDGDTISLYYNDKKILDHYCLKKNKRVLQLHYNKNIKINKLVLHAHNLGTIGLNTAAVIIKSGDYTKKVTLHSSLDNSDVIYFSLKKTEP